MKRQTPILVVAAAVVAWTAGPDMVAAQTAGPASLLAIRGATILTITNGTIPNGTVLVRDGKIAAVGANVEVPASAEIVDATGKFLTPGIIDAHSHIAAESINEGGTTVSSMTGIEDVLDPTDVSIYRDLAGGCTTANVLHGSANPIGGKNSVIKLRWGKTRAEDLLFDGAVPGIKFALGENPKRPGSGQGRGPRRYPATRQGVEFVIRDAFTRAKAYQKAWTDYRARRAAGQPAMEPRRDLQLEPLVEVLEGKRIIHAHAYRADEMLMLMRLADEMGFKIASFEHTLEGYKVAKEMAAHGIVASSFADWWGYKEEVIDAIPYAPAIMTKKGVDVAISSDSAEHARRLNLEAAKAIKWGGLTEDEALRMVTINPAKSLRVDKRVGSIEVGKDADLVVWTKHPLSTYTTVERTYIDGILYYDRQTDERRVAELEREKAALVAAEAAAAKGKAGGKEAPRAAAEPAAPTEAAGGLVAPPPPSGPGQAPADGPIVAITNARLHPVTSPTIERGTLIIRGTRIAAVGADVQVPPGAKVIDTAGADVYPGWIDAASSLGITEPGPGGWYNDASEMLDYNAQLRTRVAYKADSDAIAIARTNGITASAIFPSGGVIAGDVPVMNLDGWTWEEATVRPSIGIVLNFPAIRGGGGFGGGGGGTGASGRERTYDDLKKERDKKLDEIAAIFDDARAYAKAGPDRIIDWALDALGPIVSGRQPLFVATESEADIRDAIAFAERLKVRLVLGAGPEAALVAPLLAEKKVPVILAGVLTTPSRDDVFHTASYQAPAVLARAGVNVVLSSGGGATNVRLLPYHAAMAVAWGLDRDEAIKAMTIRTAELLGVSDLMGSLEPGKLANLFVANGDPLDIRTAVTHVFINGRDVGISDRHRELYEKWMARQ
ncbi:MAG: amidohydrolase family protein [Acidobacteriota bacterium]